MGVPPWFWHAGEESFIAARVASRTLARAISPTKWISNYRYDRRTLLVNFVGCVSLLVPKTHGVFWSPRAREAIFTHSLSKPETTVSQLKLENDEWIVDLTAYCCIRRSKNALLIQIGVEIVRDNVYWMNGSWDAYLASPADFAGADDIITNLAKEREPGIGITERTY